MPSFYVIWSEFVFSLLFSFWLLLLFSVVGLLWSLGELVFVPETPESLFYDVPTPVVLVLPAVVASPILGVSNYLYFKSLIFVLLQKWTYHLFQIPHTIYYTFPCPVMILENSNFSFLMVELSIIQQIFCFVLQHSVRFCYNVSSRSFCLSNKQNNLSKASLGHFDSAKDAQWIQPFACQNRMFVLILEILVHKEVFQRRRISSKSKLDVFELSTLSNLDGYFYNQVSSP